MAWWIWIVLGAVLLTAEVIISTDFWLVFVGIAALITGLLVLFGAVSVPWQQWLLFAALAVLMLWSYRRFWKHKLAGSDQPMGPELVGEAGVVTVAIPAGGRGRLELRGSTWDAHNAGDVDLEPGSRFIVEQVNGLTLTVRPE